VLPDGLRFAAARPPRLAEQAVIAYQARFSGGQIVVEDDDFGPMRGEHRPRTSAQVAALSKRSRSDLRIPIGGLRPRRGLNPKGAGQPAAALP
jgi:hypothetical protein